jgi:tRNA wybutosine-synthesizing protein 1
MTTMMMNLSALLDLWHALRLYILGLVALVLAWKVVKERNSSPPGSPIIKVEKGLLRPISATEKENSASSTSTVESRKSAPLPVDFTSVGPTKSQRKVKKYTAANVKIRQNGRIQPLPSVDSKMIVFYSTLTGSSERYAKRVHEHMSAVMTNPVELHNIDYLEDLDSYFVNGKQNAGTIYLLIVPSYETESPLDFFIETLKETYNDFRIDSRPLQSLGGFSVFAVGDQEQWPEEDKFCYQGILVDKLLGKLGGKRIFPIGMGCIKTSIDDNIQEWLTHLEASVKDPVPVEEVDIADSDDEDDAEQSKDVVDVEDMGSIIERSKKSTATSSASSLSSVSKQMVAKDSPTYNSLTKQGYTVVGSHSGVKICRWTKSALRGRGSCYKYSFYGIKSHLCMETTPSLSCSNKCVFCWRHGTNPVGTTWRWQVDEPEDIINGALEGHYKKIKQMKGVPGVQAARFAEAFQVRHCALSLVGEPIFYPHINRFLELLHEKHISSFLVCNAQHPNELRALKRVTQLYVSIDASDKESLRKVDRPLHRDYWERLQECLSILREKQNQRTVFRLTLVKDFNIEEHDGYADFAAKALPCFIEVKGVTYCGTSKSNPLTMQNVPFYEEVKAFVEKLNTSLAARGLEYDIAAEHAHSCCILLAQKKFKIDGKWHTAIDYDKFFKLLESGKDFAPLDYVAPTPEFAIWGSPAAGFNPDDVRFSRGKPLVQ